jgi:hypothetical protein
MDKDDPFYTYTVMQGFQPAAEMILIVITTTTKIITQKTGTYEISNPCCCTPLPSTCFRHLTHESYRPQDHHHHQSTLAFCLA